MTTLRQILDQTLELLEYDGKYKSFGDLQKAKYQASKPDEDREIRRLMYAGGLGNSQEALEKAKATKKIKKAQGEYDKTFKKAAKKRADWYKNSENLENFKKALRKRDKKRRT